MTQLHTKVERAIIGALIPYLNGAGWKVAYVDDGEETTKVETTEQALEAIFAVDDAYLAFRSDFNKTHSVRLILGNGEDVISDWNYSPGDADEFSAVMDRFVAMIDDCTYNMLPPKAKP